MRTREVLVLEEELAVSTMSFGKKQRVRRSPWSEAGSLHASAMQKWRGRDKCFRCDRGTCEKNSGSASFATKLNVQFIAHSSRQLETLFLAHSRRRRRCHGTPPLSETRLWIGRGRAALAASYQAAPLMPHPLDGRREPSQAMRMPPSPRRRGRWPDAPRGVALGHGHGRHRA